MNGSRTYPEVHRAARRVLALALLAAIAACATIEGAKRPARSTGPDGAEAPGASGAAVPTPTPRAEGAPPRPQSETSAATQALIAQSRTARATGSYAQASATIERALRIAPSDPQLWVELGEIQLASGDAAQAATLARKALTLAADDSAVIAEAQKLLRAAGGR